MTWSQISLGHHRLIPLLTLVMLLSPVYYLTGFCHELGHGLIGLGQGFSFTGIVLGRNSAYAMVQNSPSVSIGGWIGQYALAVGVGLASWKAKPRSFTARSLVFIIVIQNLLGPPLAIASLTGDSGNLLAMISPPLSASLVVAVLEGTAAALFIIGFYYSTGIAQRYFEHVFPWMSEGRSRYLALLAVALSAANVTLTFPLPWIGPLFLIPIFGLAFAFIPTRPALHPSVPTGPARTTFVITLLIFVLSEAIYYFVLPITIPL